MNERFPIGKGYNIDITDETRELLAEGKHRQRIHEGMAPVVTDEGGKVIGFRVEGEVVSGCVGTRKMAGHGRPMAEAFAEAARDGHFNLYLPSVEDEKGLEQELKDLGRDGELMSKHEQVKYKGDSE